MELVAWTVLARARVTRGKLVARTRLAWDGTKVELVARIRLARNGTGLDLVTGIRLARAV